MPDLAHHRTCRACTILACTVILAEWKHRQAKKLKKTEREKVVREKQRDRPAPHLAARKQVFVSISSLPGAPTTYFMVAHVNFIMILHRDT